MKNSLVPGDGPVQSQIFRRVTSRSSSVSPVYRVSKSPALGGVVDSISSVDGVARRQGPITARHAEAEAILAGPTGELSFYGH